MATLSTPGIGSSLPVSDIITKLVAIERAPIEKLQSQASTINSKLSSFGLLQSYMGNIRDIADKLSKPDFFVATTASTTDTSLTVSSTPTAVNGSYSVEVSQLAGAQNLASKAYAGGSSSTIGDGSIRIQLGGWSADGTSFTADPIKPPVDITIAPGEDSMEAIKTKINAANAGVTASIVNDSSGSRLVIRSTATGVQSAVKISVTDGDGNDSDANGLSALAYDPPSGTGRMTQTLAAKDTLAKINGLDVSSGTTKLENVIDGVTLTATKVTTNPVTVNVGLDTATTKKAISDFAKAFSDINAYISAQTKYDATTKKAGALQADRSTLTLQSTVRNMMTSTTTASSTYSRLNDIGLELQKDGSMKVNDAKLSAALANNPAEVAKLFSAPAPGDVGGQGLAVRTKAMATSLVATDGAITSRTKGLRDSIVRNSTDQEKLEARVALTEARLTKQYTALDSLMSQISGTNSSLSQSLTSLANLSKSLYSS